MVIGLQFIDGDFASHGVADRALCDAGFSLQSGFGIWRSDDGKVDAVIKRRYLNGRFYIVLFAS